MEHGRQTVHVQWTAPHAVTPSWDLGYYLHYCRCCSTVEMGSLRECCSAKACSVARSYILRCSCLVAAQAVQRVIADVRSLCNTNLLAGRLSTSVQLQVTMRCLTDGA